MCYRVVLCCAPWLQISETMQAWALCCRGHVHVKVEVREHSSGLEGNIKVGLDFLNHHHEAGGILRCDMHTYCAA